MTNIHVQNRIQRGNALHSLNAVHLYSPNQTWLNPEQRKDRHTPYPDRNTQRQSVRKGASLNRIYVWRVTGGRKTGCVWSCGKTNVGQVIDGAQGWGGVRASGVCLLQADGVADLRLQMQICDSSRRGWRLHSQIATGILIWDSMVADCDWSRKSANLGRFPI